ncbi:Calponin homology domain-containing proteinromo [Phytophthora infestans]|uniref:Calponin homology domain-containing proteinromo n=1 Tax=Phytophthora infestans TaxID=4787 RepID=A0A833VZJ4_PHYIN|nr:Calponin homology domain-containing proteinromo [Phytophthora infestans]
MPSDRIGMPAPLTTFTGLAGSSHFRAIVTNDKVVELSTDELVAQQKHLQTMQDALTKMHQAAARKRWNERQGVVMPKYEIGDFVLAASVLPRRNKLALYWTGPKRIVSAENDYTFQVQDLVAPYTITVHHASRLKLYRNSQREVTEDILAHIHHGAGGHIVERLLDCRKGPEDYELNVQWVGLDPLEASWEPARVMIEDIPKLVASYVAAHPKHKTLQAMWKALAPAAPQRKRGGE